VLAVRGRRAGWLRVIAPELGNGRTGWMRASDARLGGVPYSVMVDLSERELVVRRDRRVVRRVRVAIGQEGVPTPTGQFAVTDTLQVRDPDSPYGCCALALSARQPNLPEGWPGGDRIAVHATRDADSVGQAVSFGCLRAPTADARWLIETVPLGAPVKIQA
jgi:lipoprotein-anchoring transpeptidase ErfK/SrfK